jgi:hypothetical protein
MTDKREYLIGTYYESSDQWQCPELDKAWEDIRQLVSDMDELGYMPVVSNGIHLIFVRKFRVAMLPDDARKESKGHTTHD